MQALADASSLPASPQLDAQTEHLVHSLLAALRLDSQADLGRTPRIESPATAESSSASESPAAAVPTPTQVTAAGPRRPQTTNSKDFWFMSEEKWALLSRGGGFCGALLVVFTCWYAFLSGLRCWRALRLLFASRQEWVFGCGGAPLTQGQVL